MVKQKKKTASHIKSKYVCMYLLDFLQKVNSGQAQYSSSGFGGKGLEHIEKEREKAISVQKHVCI